MRTQRGFTLIEVLAALAVFAVAAVMAYGGLNHVLRGQAQAEAMALELASLQTAFGWLERDLAAAAPRPVRDLLGGRLAAMQASPQSSPMLQFTRSTLGLPGRPPLQRIAYTLDEQRLLRLSWPVLDRAPRTAPHAEALLEGVQAFRLRFLGQDWSAEWPAGGAGTLPRAVEVELTLDSGLEVRRLLRVSG